MTLLPWSERQAHSRTAQGTGRGIRAVKPRPPRSGCPSATSRTSSVVPPTAQGMNIRHQTPIAQSDFQGSWPRSSLPLRHLYFARQGLAGRGPGCQGGQSTTRLSSGRCSPRPRPSPARFPDRCVHAAATAGTSPVKDGIARSTCHGTAGFDGRRAARTREALLSVFPATIGQPRPSM
jgi:hypothetical protein